MGTVHRLLQPVGMKVRVTINPRNVRIQNRELACSCFVGMTPCYSTLRPGEVYLY